MEDMQVWGVGDMQGCPEFCGLSQDIGARLVEVVMCGKMVWRGELTKVGVAWFGCLF